MASDKNTYTDSWLSETGQKICEEDLRSIYECHMEQQMTFLDLHYKNRNYYMTIVSALLAIFVGGILQFYKEALTFILFAIPVTVIVLSELAKRTMDRYYQRFLESVVIIAKIEHMTGLDRPLKTHGHPKILWSKDRQFLPDRWTEHRYDHESSQQFLEERMKKGDNRYAHWVFNVLEGITIILALLSFAILLQVHTNWFTLNML